MIENHIHMHLVTLILKCNVLNPDVTIMHPVTLTVHYCLNIVFSAVSL